MGVKQWPCLWLVLVPALSVAAERPDERLLEAAAQADVAAVRTLLTQGVDVDAPYGDGATALHRAVHRNSVELVDLLIGAGAAVNAANDLGVTPLWLAGQIGSAETTERLLAAGANPNVRLPRGQTPLMVASRSGNARAVQLLLAAGADPDASEHEYDHTALMWAAVEGHAEAVQALLAGGADVRARSKAWSENILFAGFEYVIGARTDDWDIPQERRGGWNPLIFAARSGDIATAAALLQGGASINEPAANGATALVLAAHAAHGKLAAFLLEHGADPNLDGAGYTALHAAILRRDVETVKVLLAHGADPNLPITRAHPAARDSYNHLLSLRMVGATPFWQAASFKEFELLRVLAAHGAEPGFVMKAGGTALAAVLWRGDASQQHDRITDERKILEAAKFVVSLGVDVNLADEEWTYLEYSGERTVHGKETPLHIAASRGFDSVIQYLIEQGAHLEPKNANGHTPLALATRARATSTVDLLSALGAKE